MKVTYGGKAFFLLVSWLILFYGLDREGVDSRMFFASIVIYTGSIVFDLIFMIIETDAKTTSAMERIHKGSYALFLANFLIGFFALLGALGAFVLIFDNEGCFIRIAESGFTQVFKQAAAWRAGTSWYMGIVLIFGELSIFPGWYLRDEQKKKQAGGES